MFQQGLTDTLSATEIRQSIDQTQERTKRSTAGSSAHGFSCSRRLSPLSGRNSTYRPVQISGTGSFLTAQPHDILLYRNLPHSHDRLRRSPCDESESQNLHPFKLIE